MDKVVYNIVMYGKHLTGKQLACITEVMEMKT